MRVRVRFRYRTDTGEIEMFRVEDVADQPADLHHDERHEAAARDVARVVDPHARIVEEVGSEAQTEQPQREPVIVDPEPSGQTPREVRRA